MRFRLVPAWFATQAHDKKGKGKKANSVFFSHGSTRKYTEKNHKQKGIAVEAASAVFGMRWWVTS